MPEKILKKSDFDQLLAVLVAKGYDVFGPQVKDGAIVYAPLSDASQLPQDYTDEQTAGNYRLHHDSSGRWFSWANAAQGIKPLIFTPSETMWSVKKTDDGKMSFTENVVSEKPKAIIGVRNCDLAALRLQDQHFLEQTQVDSSYAARRNGLFLVAVNCTHPAKACFCNSTRDGPIAITGFDLVLDELDHAFLLKAGSSIGESIVKSLALHNANDQSMEQVERQHESVKSFPMPQLPNINIQQRLKKAIDATGWDEIARQCLSCGNCTSVCPTCFCYSEHDEPKLDGSLSHRVREWDSCFNQSHSYIHGIVIRSETKFRYRQWLTHKFSGWFDQYGRSGCVGCGRCVTWCPVGIDVIDAISKVCEEQSD